MSKPAATPLELGIAAAQAGDFSGAAAIARSLQAADPDDVGALQIFGFIAFRQGRLDDALRVFIDAVRRQPGQPALLYWLGVLFRERGDLAQAERAFRNAVNLAPHYGEAWRQLGETLYFGDQAPAAKIAFDRALEAEPQSVSILAGCARFYETIHDLPNARMLAEKAVSLGPDSEMSAIALAEIELREGNYAAAQSVLEPLILKDGGDPRSRAKMLQLLSNAFDRTGRYADAFAALKKSHALQREMTSDRVMATPSPLHNSAIDRMIEFLKATDFSAWSRHEALDGPAPAFLIGFVRSGTTWLDQILSSHSQISVMEEEDNFLDIWPELATGGRLYEMPGSTLEEVNRMRRLYWARARKTLRHAGGQVIVDKTPLNTVQLGVIHRIFPDAKIIFAIRDPRDCVLSAFQQHFQINAGMFHFLDIETAARFYDRVMTIGDIVRREIRPNLCDVRYENIVADLETEARRIINFLGLDWEDAVLAYRQTARDRAVRTPSRRQVVEAPYTTSIGKWRRYRTGIAPALPTLAPWVAKFGYEAD